MKLVVGLGNPGGQYEGSRHNVGFRVADLLGRRHSIGFKKGRFHSELADIIIGSERVLLLKPLTYMNNSGIAVRECVDYFNIPTEEIIVVYDDMDLEPGRIRVRYKGGAGGHKGVRSIISHLGTESLPRVRVGIGRPAPSDDAINYVLRWFSKEEVPIIGRCIALAADCIETWASEGMDAAMNRYNAVREELIGGEPAEGREDHT